MLILSYLPIPSLLSFGATSKKNHEFHFGLLETLQLAVFPRKVHALVAILQPAYGAASRFNNYVSVITPNRFQTSGAGGSNACYIRSPSLSLAETIVDQNLILAKIVARYGSALRDLEFLAWDLNAQAATALAQSCGSLRQLALCFDHPNVRDRSLPRTYFDKPGPGSTVWNALAGIGQRESAALKLRSLQRLSLERCSVTEWQLQKVVEANPGLSELRLQKCAGVGPDFLSWLSQSRIGREQVEVLWLQCCDAISSHTALGLSWVHNMGALRVRMPPFHPLWHAC